MRPKSPDSGADEVEVSVRGDDGLWGLTLLGRSPFLKPALRSASLVLRVPGGRRVLRRLAMLDRTA